jgi:hypothetical protein
MHLLINGEEVSYSLENERTLGEVVRGVQGWLNASGFLVTEVAADTRDLLATPEHEWSSQPVENTRELSVKAAHTGDMRIEHWSTVHAWLGMLADEIAAPGAAPRGPADLDVLGELVAGLPQTLESFTANPFLPPGSDTAGRFAALFAGVPSAEIRRWPAEKNAQAASLLAELRSRIESRLTAARQPRETAARCVATLKGLLGGLSEVSVMLQTGRDRQAMDVVIGFTDAAQSLIDLLPFLPPDAERSRLVSELTPVLRELTKAFDTKDGILIGDLLEYEIAPRMERITPLIEKGL